MAHLYQPGSNRPMSDINVVPFIDVMLVLLVIFMVTAPLLTQGVNVDLPKTQAKPIAQEQKEPLVVTVDSIGNYYLNLADNPNKPIAQQTLSSLVKSQLAAQQNNEQRPVLVRGDKNVNYGKIMEAMVLLQEAGAKSVGLITQPIPSDRKTS